MGRVYLETIIADKRKRIDELNYDVHKLKVDAKNIANVKSFKKAMIKDGLSIIGEIKKASPSKGLIKPDFDAVKIARQYDGVVDAISVLTEEKYFLGKDEYLKDVSFAVSLPTLCKDFIIDQRQIYRAKILGASCILLIVAILDKEKIIEFIKLAYDLSMDVLVEIHTLSELKVALACGADIIGVNNRDLNSFETDINNTLKLVRHIPKDKVIISESGIMNLTDVKKLKEVDIDGILVGESFMRSSDIKTLAKDIKDEYKS